MATEQSANTQHPTPSTHLPTYDAAIVGGGVAGSALAVALARAGRAVLLVERAARFRDRVRGDALFPWGALEASRLGIADLLPAAGARPLPVWQSYTDREPNPPYHWRDDVPSGDVVWGVNHPALQETLFRHAGEAGAVTLRPAKAPAPARERDGAHLLPLETAQGTMTVRARLVVGADGRESGVRRWLGAETVRDPVHHVIGGCLVSGIDLDPDAAHLSDFDGGRALVFFHANGNARAYLICQPEAAVTIRGPHAPVAFLAACAEVFPEGAFARARAVGAAAFFPAADVFADRIAGDGVVLVGDAAGANDPSEGKGLSLALRDARELSELLAGDDWQAAIEAFARRRPRWYDPLRAYAIWNGPLVTDVGPEADAARARAARAKERDPLLWGYRLIHALGPDGLPVSEAARRHVLGEDLAGPAVAAD